jgi:DNA-binding beta-propeller fold protein YncE
VEPSEAREGSVSQFTIAADGSLTPKTPAAVPAGSEPKGIAISPGGANLYVADSTETGRISQFSIGPEGMLAPLTPAAVRAGRQPFGLAVGLDDRRLYVSNSAEYTIGGYEIESGGALRAMPSPPAPAGEWPMSVVLVETEREPTIGQEEPRETKPPPGAAPASRARRKSWRPNRKSRAPARA